MEEWMRDQLNHRIQLWFETNSINKLYLKEE